MHLLNQRFSLYNKHVFATCGTQLLINTPELVGSQNRPKQLADSCVELFADGRINFDGIKGLKMMPASLGLAEEKWEGNSSLQQTFLLNLVH